jgi:hypothetical protein
MKFIIFLIYPFATFFSSLFQFREKQNQYIVLCFFMMAGYQTLPYADMMLYVEKFNEIKELDLKAFTGYIASKFILESNYEVFVELNAFIISRFTDNVRYTFVVTVIVFFIVWRGLINILIREYDFFGRKNRNALYFLLCFAIYVIFYRVINGRFYLAYWIFMFSFHKIFMENRKKYFILFVFTILVHQAFLFLCILSLLYFFINKYIQNKKTEYVLLVLIIIGTLYSQLGVNYLSKYLTFFGANYEDQYSDYLKDSYIDGQLERDRKWFLLLRTPLLFYTLGFHILYLRFVKKINFEKDNILYFFILIFWGINAFTIEVPSFGARFRNVLIGFFLVLLFKLYNREYQTKLNYLVLISIAFFVFYKVVSLKILEFYINKWTFYPFSMAWFALFDEPITN